MWVVSSSSSLHRSEQQFIILRLKRPACFPSVWMVKDSKAPIRFLYSTQGTYWYWVPIQWQYSLFSTLKICILHCVLLIEIIFYEAKCCYGTKNWVGSMSWLNKCNWWQKQYILIMYILYLCGPVMLWPISHPLNKVSIGTNAELLVKESVQPNDINI